MERRSEQRHRSDRTFLLLTFGCHVRGQISDWSQQGLGLMFDEGMELEDGDPMILYCDIFGVVQAKVIWKRDDKVGARILNWKTVAVSRRIQPGLL